LTVTLNVQVLVFPDVSVKVYVTGVVPVRKVLPGTCDFVTAIDPVGEQVCELSVAVGSVQVTTAVHPDPVIVVMFGGQFETTGF